MYFSYEIQTHFNGFIKQQQPIFLVLNCHTSCWGNPSIVGVKYYRVWCLKMVQ